MPWQRRYHGCSNIEPVLPVDSSLTIVKVCNITYRIYSHFVFCPFCAREWRFDKTNQFKLVLVIDGGGISREIVLR